jgi:hypothetical protein
MSRCDPLVRLLRWRIVVPWLVALSGCATAPQAPPNVIPGPLEAPSGETPFLHAHAEGTQSYECASSGDHAEWKFKGPNAVLSGDGGALLGIHYGGPTWQAADGSKVVGTLVASAPARDGHSIPQLLLKAKAHTGDGVFTKVRSIQRLATHGGQPPGVRCSESEVGQKIDVPYSATYVFLVERDRD